MDARVLLIIQLRANGTLRSRITPTAYRNADARRIQLRGANIIRRMQGDDLVAQNVVAVLDGLWDRDVPRAVGLAEDIIRPPPGFAAADAELQLAHLLDLEELQLGLVDGGAVAVAGCQVGDDGSVVRLGPCRPVQVDDAAGGDRGGGLLRVGGVDGADNVGAVDGAAVDGTQVGVPRGPADGALVGDPGGNGGIVARIVLVTDGEGVDPTVGGDGGRTEQHGKEGSRGAHVGGGSGEVRAWCNVGRAWPFEFGIVDGNGT